MIDLSAEIPLTRIGGNQSVENDHSQELTIRSFSNDLFS